MPMPMCTNERNKQGVKMSSTKNGFSFSTSYGKLRLYHFINMKQLESTSTYNKMTLEISEQVFSEKQCVSILLNIVRIE